MHLSTRACAALLLVGAAAAQDISVSQLGINNNAESYQYWGMSGGIRAYSIATTACNVGDVDVQWMDSIKKAPIIGTNLFRMRSDGQFQQLGYGFVKYSFCALDEGQNGCPGSCSPNGTCDWLSPDCSDTYWATLNDGKNGGAKWQIDPVTGAWPAGSVQGPTGDPTIRGRIQVKNTELQDGGALYFAEGQYLSEHDQFAGNIRNNWAWRPIVFTSPTNIDNIGTTQMGDPAIYAWQANANGVHIDDVHVVDEGGPGLDGLIFVGSRAVDLGGGLWRYQYAIQNGNSARGVGSFTLPLHCSGATVTDLEFHKPDYHSGSPYANTPWVGSATATEVTWATDDWSIDPDGAAIRWGTVYSFAFTADVAPSTSTATVGLFTPGTPSDVSATVVAPSGAFVGYCTANANSTGNPSVITASGSPFVADNSLGFDIVDLPVDVFGYLLMSQSTDFVPLFGGSMGNLCLGSPQIRFSDDVLTSGATGTMSYQVDNTDLPQNAMFLPGDTWYFQLWHRDHHFIPATSNTTAGVQVTFCN